MPRRLVEIKSSYWLTNCKICGNEYREDVIPDGICGTCKNKERKEKIKQSVELLRGATIKDIEVCNNSYHSYCELEIMSIVVETKNGKIITLQGNNMDGYDANITITEEYEANEKKT